MTRLSENIVGKIKQDHIAPVPRWHFLLKSYVFWSLLVISILLGSLSFSVIAHLMIVGDFDTLKHLQGNAFTSALLMLPYFWFFSLGMFGIVAYYNWKQTKLGYKFKRRWLFTSSIFLSISLGSVLHVFGMGNAVDGVMVKAMPFYDQSKHRARNEVWLQPKNGLIMGKVTNVDSVNNQIMIQDVQGKDWQVDEKAVTPAVAKSIKKGKIVKVIGKQDGESKFIANEIRRCRDCQDDEDEEGDEDEKDEKEEGDDDDKKAQSRSDDEGHEDNEAERN